MRDPEAVWLSVRMRAESAGAHLSGGERLVPAAHGPAVARSLLLRASHHAEGMATRVVLTVDVVEERDIRRVPALRVRTLPMPSVCAGREESRRLLGAAGVSGAAAERALALLTRGANPDGGNMRGALLMEKDTGERLEEDPCRGVRVSVVDMAPGDRAWLQAAVRGRVTGDRFRDALILASKVAAVEGIVAELCWSDDPTYTAGYVASRTLGYVRLCPLKEPDVPLGGRVYFVNTSCFERDADIRFLESVPVLVTIDDDTVLEEA
jgi:6-carboxyhexanoate--CoA ligase